ncbi:unnamed protein product, partial [marine sediment metagenome]
MDNRRIQTVEEIQKEIRKSLPKRPKPKTRTEILDQIYKELLGVQVELESIKLKTK